ncbi:MAG: serine--tRNA ligase [Nanoarchaeota archaeon]
MLDPHFVRENPTLVKKNLSKKFQEYKNTIVDEFLQKDKEWRQIKTEVDKLRNERNKLSLDINNLKKEKKSPDKILTKVKTVVNLLTKKERLMHEAEQTSHNLLKKLPNTIHDSVPIGKDDTENPTIKELGKKPNFDFPIKNHVELGEALHILDFDSSAKTSGNGFYFLHGKLAHLNRALLQFAVDFMEKKGYNYIEPPLLLRKEVLGAAIDLEEFEKTIYSIEKEDLALIGTSEHSLLGMHAGQVFHPEELPKKYYSYSMCFRKEKGAHGINEKGLWRTHQFNKVEQFIFCKPEESYQMYDELLENSEEILQLLDLPYRVIEICSGDLAAWKTKSADVEVWRPTINGYGEVMSLSNCTDYQARDLNIRFITNDNKQIVHTLNNTALATSRILVAIMENYQQRDGSIHIPNILQKYTGFKTIEREA